MARGDNWSTGNYFEASAAAIGITLPPFTIAARFRSPDVAGTDAIAGFYNSTSTDNWQLIYLVSSDRFRAATLQSGTAFAEAPTPIVQNAWQVGVGTWSASNRRDAYLNSSTNTGSSIINKNPVGTDRFRIGISGTSNPGLPLEGDIDWLAIWDTAITPASVDALGGGAHPKLVEPDRLRCFLHCYGTGSLVDEISGVPFTQVGAIPEVHSPPLAIGGPWFISRDVGAPSEVTGDANVTLNSQGLSADGDREVDGDATSTLNAQTISVIGDREVDADAASTLNAQSIDADGTTAPPIAIEGDAAVTLNAQSIDADGTVAGVVAGTSAVTLNAQSISAVGDREVVSTSAVILNSQTLDADGSREVAGNSAVILNSQSIDADGDTVGFVDGDAAVTLNAQSISAVGTREVLGDSAVTLNAMRVFGTDTLNISEVTLNAMSVKASGIVSKWTYLDPTDSPWVEQPPAVSLWTRI